MGTCIDAIVRRACRGRANAQGVTTGQSHAVEQERGGTFFLFLLLFRTALPLELSQQLSMTRIHCFHAFCFGRWRYYVRMRLLRITSSVDTTGTSVTVGRRGIPTPGLSRQSNAFISVDYSAVIDTLQPVNRTKGVLKEVFEIEARV